MLTNLDEKKKNGNQSGMKRKGVDASTVGGVVDNLENNDDHNDVKLPAWDVNNSNSCSINNSDTVEEEHESFQMTKKGKIGFAAMAQAIAAKWKMIDEPTLTHYRQIASEDMKRYRKEMETYNKQDGGDDSDGKNNMNHEQEGNG